MEEVPDPFRHQAPHTGHVQRQGHVDSKGAEELSFLAELTSDVRRFAGKANVVADALSTLPPSGVASVKGTVA
jgi:hypothetical protein